MDNIRFSMMTLEEIVACYHPPILPGIIEHVFVRNLITDATCYISAKMCGQVTKFTDYNNNPRRYLLSDHPLELWNTSEYDVTCETLWGKKTKAEKTIQSYFKRYLFAKRFNKRTNEIVKIQVASRSHLFRKSSINSQNLEV
ncbi:uncharacterized protein LOC111641027 [Centruroides sculpturatus]|uniref:uncharacterized protein LOC111641027 n=1 Tax=Centruroides sculpturatus TaxID=218467 RepID=UPI000C6CD1B1|nr:uncharacterized protein LOC111641027 [Centruroides sculpturatus]